MVSGLVTSPCDQLRIFSGLASEIRMESKSAIRFARSYGEERYIWSAMKISSLSLCLTERRFRVPFRDYAVDLSDEPTLQIDVNQDAEDDRQRLPKHHELKAGHLKR